MAADEQQTQDVVAIMLSIELIRERRLRIVVVREHFLGRQLLLLAAPALVVQRGIAPDKDQPGSRVTRRTLHRPDLQSAQRSLLERLLGRVQIPEIPQQRSDRLRTGGGQGGVEPAEVSHACSLAYPQGRPARGGSDMLRAQNQL